MNLCRVGDVLEYLLVPSTQTVKMVMELCGFGGEEPAALEDFSNEIPGLCSELWQGSGR